jgi:outer membrane protein
VQPASGSEGSCDIAAEAKSTPVAHRGGGCRGDAAESEQPLFKETMVTATASAMRASSAFLMVLMGSFAVAPAVAGEETAFGGHLILGGAMVPDYEGSDDYQPVPFAAGKLAYDEYYIEARGPGLRANIMPADVFPFGFELGPSLAYRFGRDDVKNDSVDDLRDIDGTVAVGGFAKIYTTAVLQVGDEIGFEVEVESGIGSDRDGTTIKFGPSYSFSPWDSMRLGFNASATYASDRYNETYFGIDSDNALRSGLPTYDAEGGIKDLGVSVNATYVITEQWAITGNVRVTQLVGDAADSPIVDDAGSATQGVVAAGLVFNF